MHMLGKEIGCLFNATLYLGRKIYHCENGKMLGSSKKGDSMGDAKRTRLISLGRYISVFQDRPDRGHLICLKICLKKGLE